jgi:hypothetical protein
MKNKKEYVSVSKTELRSIREDLAEQVLDSIIDELDLGFTYSGRIRKAIIGSLEYNDVLGEGDRFYVVCTVKEQPEAKPTKKK